jgi:hypothetical protein
MTPVYEARFDAPPPPRKPVSTAGPDNSEPANDTHAKYADAVGGGPRTAMNPKFEIASPPATIDVPPHAGADAAIRAVPGQIPMGQLNRDTLEGPLRDPLRFARCAIPRTTRVDIVAAIYNGQAIGVDVRADPRDRPLEFCVEGVVRQTTWVKELAIERVHVKL